MRVRLGAWLLAAASLAAQARAAEVVYAGPADGKAARVAEALRGRAGAERLRALDSPAAVVELVRSGAAEAGVIPEDAGEQALLAALDPGLRAARLTEQDDEAFWAITRPGGKPEDHPDHVAVNLESERAAKALSDVVAGLQRLGFSLERVAQRRLPASGPDARPAVRYLLVFASDRPLLLIRVTDVLARDVRMGDGRARLIGSWRQAG